VKRMLCCTLKISNGSETLFVIKDVLRVNHRLCRSQPHRRRPLVLARQTVVVAGAIYLQHLGARFSGW